MNTVLKNSKELHYPLAVNLDKSVKSCKTLNDLSNKVCVSNKTEDLNLIVSNMIIGINESKTLLKHISCKCKCKFDGRKWNSNQKWNNDKCRCECKKHHICEKGYIWNPATCSCEIGKYLASIIDNSVIMCDEIIDVEEKKIFKKILMEEQQPKFLYFTSIFVNYYSITDSC